MSNAPHPVVGPVLADVLSVVLFVTVLQLVVACGGGSGSSPDAAVTPTDQSSSSIAESTDPIEVAGDDGAASDGADEPPVRESTTTVGGNAPVEITPEMTAFAGSAEAEALYRAARQRLIQHTGCGGSALASENLVGPDETAAAIAALPEGSARDAATAGFSAMDSADEACASGAEADWQAFFATAVEHFETLGELVPQAVDGAALEGG